MLLSRCGWPFVAIDQDSEVTAAAFGVPPDWVNAIGGAEAWAVHVAASRALPGAKLRVECQPCMDMAEAAPEVPCQAKRMLARV